MERFSYARPTPAAGCGYFGPKRRYERLDISGLTGITAAQRVVAAGIGCRRAIVARARFVGYLAQRLAVAGELALDELRFSFGIDRHERKLGLGDDYRVPVAGGDARKELVTPGGAEVVLARHQQFGQRIQVLELLGELLEDVTGNDDQDLNSQTEPAELHCCSRNDRRLPGSYLMEQADGGLASLVRKGEDRLAFRTTSRRRLLVGGRLDSHLRST
jgi:hypothetical protein